MTESPRTPAEQDKIINPAVKQDPERHELRGSAPASSSIGVYDSSSATSPASGNRLWLILLIVLIIVIVFFVLRRWM